MSAENVAREIALLRRRLDALERSASMASTSLEDGAFTVYDDLGNQVIQVGALDDGGYGVDGEAIINELALANEAVTAAKIATDAITTVHIDDEVITAAKVAADAITEIKVDNAAITEAKLAAAAVTETKIADGSVSTPKLVAGAVQAGTIAAGAVTTDKLAASAITADKLAANAVTAGKIAAGAVEAGTIAAGAVTTAELAAGAVTANEIAANAITSIKIDAAAIQAGHIAVGAISADKIAANAITGDKIQANAIDGMTITGAVIQTSASGHRITMLNEGGSGEIQGFDDLGNQVIDISPVSGYFVRGENGQIVHISPSGDPGVQMELATLNNRSSQGIKGAWRTDHNADDGIMYFRAPVHTTSPSPTGRGIYEFWKTGQMGWARFDIPIHATEGLHIGGVQVLENTHAHWTSATAQSIPNATWTRLNSGTLVDPSPHVTGLAGSQTFQIETAGVYLIEASVRFAGNGSGSRHHAISDGANELQRFGGASMPSATGSHMINSSCTRRFAAGQIISHWAWQNSGGALNTDAQNDAIHISFTRLAGS